MCIAVNVSLLNYFSTLEKIYNPFDQILERFRERERERDIKRKEYTITVNIFH